MKRSLAALLLALAALPASASTPLEARNTLLLEETSGLLDRMLADPAMGGSGGVVAVRFCADHTAPAGAMNDASVYVKRPGKRVELFMDACDYFAGERSCHGAASLGIEPSTEAAPEDGAPPFPAASLRAKARWAADGILARGAELGEPRLLDCVKAWQSAAPAGPSIFVRAYYRIAASGPPDAWPSREVRFDCPGAASCAASRETLPGEPKD